MRARTTAVCLLGGAAALLAILMGVLAARAPAPSLRRPPAVSARARPAATTRPSCAESVVTCSTTAAPEGPARAALESLAGKTAGRASAALAAEALERELRAAGRAGSGAGADKASLRVRLERLLREHPEHAPGAARAFAALEDRETLFAISRALAGCADQADVRAVLDDAAASGSAARRECALIALPADAGALALAARGLEDATAAPTVRAAGAYALARGLDALSAEGRAKALRAARSVAAAPGEDAHLRAEALHLLARGRVPEDGPVAAAVLAEPDPPAELALAAAHLALETGADPADIAAALAKNPSRACALAAETLARRAP